MDLNIEFTEDMITEYISNYFENDLRRYFSIKTDKKGYMEISDVKKRGDGFVANNSGNILCRHTIEPVVIAMQLEGTQHKISLESGKLEDEFIFISLVSTMFKINSRESNIGNDKEVSKEKICMFGFPFVRELFDNRKLDEVLKDSEVLSERYVGGNKAPLVYKNAEKKVSEFIECKYKEYESKFNKYKGH